MKIVHSVQAMVALREEIPRPLGLVPTMGYLHQGHLGLVRRAKLDNDTVIVSIFVNPTQFGPNEDYGSYPRDLASDMALLEEEGVDLVFAPSAEDMYPFGFDTSVDVGRVARPLEGMARPGHFLGVTTVVTKLFTMFRPDRAYFGQKDGQQVMVIKALNVDLNLGVEVLVLPTVRETNGLAMSSRNVHLTSEERQAAGVLYQALCKAMDLWSHGERYAPTLRYAVGKLIEEEPLASLEYVSVADAQTLQELTVVENSCMVSVAVRFGVARLIDNVILGD